MGGDKQVVLYFLKWLEDGYGEGARKYELLNTYDYYPDDYKTPAPDELDALLDEFQAYMDSPIDTPRRET